jgi:hypothetical protein
MIYVSEGRVVAKKRITVTVDADVAEFLHESANTSAVVCEAIREYRARQLEKELESAYSEDCNESAKLAAEWEPADAGIEE